MRFRWILVDFRDTFGFDFETFGPWTSEKGRTGKNVKMSTALKRDAHFRGLMGVRNWQKKTRNRKWDIYFSRDDFGSQLGGIFDDLGFKTVPKMRQKRGRKASEKKEWKHWPIFFEEKRWEKGLTKNTEKGLYENWRPNTDRNTKKKQIPYSKQLLIGIKSVC